MTDPNRDGGFPVIDLPPEVDTADAAVQQLIAELVRTGWLPAEAADEVVRQVWQRERLGSTAVGRGVAVPHAQTSLVTGLVGVVGRCSRPFGWPETIGGELVGVVCLLVLPDGPPGSRLRALERVVRQLRSV